MYRARATCSLHSCVAVTLHLCGALQTAAAYARVVAKTYVDYYNYVCTCCLGKSEAYSVVQADVQVLLRPGRSRSSCTRQSGSADGTID